MLAIHTERDVDTVQRGRTHQEAHRGTQQMEIRHGATDPSRPRRLLWLTAELVCLINLSLPQLRRSTETFHESLKNHSEP